MSAGSLRARDASRRESLDHFSLQDQLALDTLIPNSIFKRYTAAILPSGSLDGGHGLHVEFQQLVVNDIEAFAK